MKNLAIIGASYLQLPLIRKAKEMGYRTHVFAWASDDVGEKEADVFYPISIVEKEAIYEECKKIGICGICSIASDLAIVTVNYVANQLGLVSNSIEATQKSTNKYYMRKTFEECGDPSPRSYLVEENTKFDDMSISFPAIVKPLDRSGSRGIFKVNCIEEVGPAVEKAIKEGFEKKALLEEFVEGQEYSVEYISYKGNHCFLALTLKETTGAPNFIEKGHMEPAPIEQEILEKIKMVVEHALESLGLENGASHSEVKVDDDGNIKIIEIGGRMGGDCIGSDLVQYSTGIDFVKAVIQVSCGEEPDLTVKTLPQPARAVFIITEEDRLEFERMKKYESDKILKIVDDSHIEMIGCTTDSSNRAGCYIVKA